MMEQRHLQASPSARTERRRALFYVFDGGSGIGHLRRLARIAEAMKNDFSCLIVTGHDVGPQWIVPEGCEYVRLPSWDNLISAKAAYWGRAPFLDVPLDDAVRLRGSILHGIVEGFRPDVIFVDHLPLGAHSEMASILGTTHSLKYLVTRGIQNETEDLQRLVLGGDALTSLERDYDRILSAIDPQIFDLSMHYGLPSKVTDKILSTGYVAPTELKGVRASVRERRGVGADIPWVVASTGSGQWGESLVEACIAATKDHPDVHFDIVMGPRSRLSRTDVLQDGRIRIHASCADLAHMHAAADVVVTAGGYNTLLEAIQGQARVLCIPYRKDHRDEPFRHAGLLQEYVDLRKATDIGELGLLLRQAIDDVRHSPPRDRRADLVMDGAAYIARVALADLAGAARPVES